MIRLRDINEDAPLRDAAILDGFRAHLNSWQLAEKFRLPEHEILAAIHRAYQEEERARCRPSA